MKQVDTEVTRVRPANSSFVMTGNRNKESDDEAEAGLSFRSLGEGRRLLAGKM